MSKKLMVSEDDSHTRLFNELVIVCYLAQKEFENGGPSSNPNPSRFRLRSSRDLLPQAFKDHISTLIERTDPEPRMVIEKILSSCDVRKSHNRLTMPERECGSKLGLTNSEKEMLGVRVGRCHVGIKVMVIDPELQVREMYLRRWFYHERGYGNFVLIGGWYDIVASSGLTEKGEVQVWSFRVNGELGFAVVKLPELRWGAKRRRGST